MEMGEPISLIDDVIVVDVIIRRHNEKVLWKQELVFSPCESDEAVIVSVLSAFNRNKIEEKMAEIAEHLA